MKNLLSILFIALAVAATAQEPEVDIDATYFHPAASMYVQGNSAGASNLVSTGLTTFPDNGKLLRLKELLDQQQEDNKDPDPNDDQQQDDQDQENEENQDQNKDEQDQNQDDQQDQQDSEQQDDQQQEPEQQPPSAEQMSKDEAQQLLDAMKQDEENKRLQLHPVMGAPVQVDKDW